MPRSMLTLFAFLGLLTSGCASVSGPSKSSLDHYNLGEQAYRAGQLQAAQQHFHKVLKVEPGHEGATFRLGNIAMLEGKLEQAGEHYLQVLQRSPRHARAHYNLAIVLLTQAENHFNYYSATTNPEEREAGLLRLLSAIDVFSRQSAPAGNPLDALADLLNPAPAQ